MKVSSELLREEPPLTRPRGWRTRAARITLVLVLVIGAVPLLAPLVWTVSTSLKPEFDVFQVPPQLIPDTFRWQNYVDIFEFAPLAQQYFNSVYIAIVNVAGTLVVSSLAGYALARLRFPGRNLILPILLMALLLPEEVTIVPLFALMSKLGWVGTHLPLLIEPVFGVPTVVGTFLMRQFFLTLPRDLADAGRVDGLGEFGVFRHVALPLARPALATLAVLTFLGSWNSFLLPLVFTSGVDTLQTLPVALTQYTDTDGTPFFALQMAATTLSIIPVVIVFMFAQRYIVEGIARSGIKG
jgi:multiple sugar transport system permease protein